MVCPPSHRPGEEWAALPPGVEIAIIDESLTRAKIKEIVARHDVVQVGPNGPRWRSGILLEFARQAQRSGKCLITGLSSNRAKTTLMNAASGGFLRRLKARIVAASILSSQRYVASISDGVFFTGHGLEPMLGMPLSNPHVGIASWIRAEDMLTPAEFEEKRKRFVSSPSLSLCVASRLERMKGVHLAVEAIAMLAVRPEGGAPALTIFGAGAEEPRLRALVASRRLEGVITFGGTLAYPEPFFSRIAEFDVLLLPNLNDEQPRVLFDAISRGVLPIFPDSPAYRLLGLPERAQFEAGSAASLAKRIETLLSRRDNGALLEEITLRSRLFTLDSMHEARARWIARTLERKLETQARQSRSLS